MGLNNELSLFNEKRRLTGSMHTALNGRTIGDWQPLEKHLKNFAEIALTFYRTFDGEDWGYGII